MSDSVSAARPTASGGVSRPTTNVSPGRLTRADAASRVAALDQSFDANLAAIDAARGILAIGEADSLEPVTPVLPFGRNIQGSQSSATPVEERNPNGRGLLSGSSPIILAENRTQEISVLASDPGLADITRAADLYRDTALRISSSRSAN